SSSRVAVRPVDDALANQLGVWDDDSDAVVCHYSCGSQVNALYVPFIFTDGDAIADSYRPFKKQDETGSYVGCEVLKTETNTNRQCGEHNSKRSKVESKCLLQCQQYADG